MDILTQIETQRRVDIISAQIYVSVDDLHAKIKRDYPDAPLNVYSLVRSGDNGCAAIAAEFKRASPSKGPLASPDASVSEAAVAYVRGGASVLSILTEPKWFKGNLADLEAARRAATTTAASLGRHRPAMLRKDFILTEYQLLEARAHGADTALLIVSSLPTDEQLRPLIEYARALGMEPLVEVNSVDETRVALRAGARLLGVNNRNLRTFTVDMLTTLRVVEFVAAEYADSASPPAILSLSGISSSMDIATVLRDCATAVGAAAARALVRGFLIGEALMRTADPAALVADFVSAADAEARNEFGSFINTDRIMLPLAKICGVRGVADALNAARSGAAFIGVILVPGSPRCVELAEARAISDALRTFREKGSLLPSAFASPENEGNTARRLVDGERREQLRSLVSRSNGLLVAAQRTHPLLVGVFMDATRDYVVSAATAAGLDVIQLHGGEAASDFDNHHAASPFPWPIVKVMHFNAEVATVVGTAAVGDLHAAAMEIEARSVASRIAVWAPVAAAVLLDSRAGGGSASGGTGAHFNASAALPALGAALSELTRSANDAESIKLPIFLAGGLTPATVEQRATSCDEASSHACGAITCYVAALDVSSGVEFDTGSAPDGCVGKGHKDPAKVDAFLAAVKRVVVNRIRATGK